MYDSGFPRFYLPHPKKVTDLCDFHDLLLEGFGERIFSLNYYHQKQFSIPKYNLNDGDRGYIKTMLGSL